VATEIEMKLAFTGDYTEPGLPQLRDVLRQEGVDPLFKEARLENAYFDTPDFQLHAAKVALRIRKKWLAADEVRFIQTLKTAGTSQNGLSQRGEWEWLLSTPDLDLPALRGCAAWPDSIKVDALQNIFETNFTRFACRVCWGGSLIELVLDWGEILSNNKTEPLHEIELELKQGQTDDLLDLAGRLQQRLLVKPLDISKAERGFGLFKR
jgi:inorganic triphosphatase YgiF